MIPQYSSHSQNFVHQAPQMVANPNAAVYLHNTRFNEFGKPQTRCANPNELFVGNLSFFCKREDLMKLFRDFRPINARIHGNDRSKMYGFVEFESPNQVRIVVNALNHRLFMGRNLK
jgi:RNA recognition motif-containing protein